jgi:hypothetical protein
MWQLISELISETKYSESDTVRQTQKEHDTSNEKLVAIVAYMHWDIGKSLQPTLHI